MIFSNVFSPFRMLGFPFSFLFWFVSLGRTVSINLQMDLYQSLEISNALIFWPLDKLQAAFYSGWPHICFFFLILLFTLR